MVRAFRMPVDLSAPNPEVDPFWTYDKKWLNWSKYVKKYIFIEMNKI